MKQSSECATFQFYSTSMSTTSFVNMREVLGDMIDKYDRFLMVLDYVSTYTNATSFAAGNHCCIRVTGLNFTNSNYNNSKGSSTGAVMPFVFVFNPNSTSSVINSSDSGVCFDKPRSNGISLTVEYCLAFRVPYDTLKPNITTDTHCTAGFTIYGLYD